MKRIQSSNYTILYISPVVKTLGIDWLWQTAQAIDKHAQVIYMDRRQWNPISFQKITRPSILKKIFWQIIDSLSGKSATWYMIGFLPFGRLNIIYRLNNRLNSWLIRFLVWIQRKQLVMIQVNHLDVPISPSELYRMFKPVCIIEDCTDLSYEEGTKQAIEYAHHVVANARPLYEWIKKQNKQVTLLSAGYMWKNRVEWLANQHPESNDQDCHNVILLGNAADRWDFEILEYIVANLPHYKFSFLTSTQIYRVTGIGNLKSMELIWKRILSYKNVHHIHINNQEDYDKYMIKGNVGIIVYDMHQQFNQFCHPIKIYHYLAMGIPVVSSPVPSIRHLESDYCQTAETKHQFVRLIKELADRRMSPKMKQHYVDIAYNQTYEKKAAQLNDLIQTLLRNSDAITAS